LAALAAIAVEPMANSTTATRRPLLVNYETENTPSSLKVESSSIVRKPFQNSIEHQNAMVRTLQRLLSMMLVQCLTLLVLYPEHSTNRPSALQPQPNGLSPAKTQRPQSKVIPNLAFLAPWRTEIRPQSSNNKCVHSRGTTVGNLPELPPLR
jgi:hypothetical protein